MEEAKVTPDMSVTDMGDALKSAMTKVTIDGLTGDEMSWSESGEVNKRSKAVVIENGEYVGNVNSGFQKRPMVGDAVRPLCYFYEKTVL